MPSSFLTLRNVLVADAATCFVMGALLVLASPQLESLMQIPQQLLFYAGLSLFPIAAFMAVVAARPSVARPAVWLVIAGNALWIAASVWLVVSGSIAPTGIGTAFILMQALGVGALAALECFTLQRLSSAPTGTQAAGS